MGYRSAGRDVWRTLTAPSLRGSNGAGHPLVRPPPTQLCWKSLITRKTPNTYTGNEARGEAHQPGGIREVRGKGNQNKNAAVRRAFAWPSISHVGEGEARRRQRTSPN